MYSADDAKDIGLVTKVLPHEELMPHVQGIAGNTGAGGDHGIAKMENRREISVSSYYDQSHYLHPHPQAELVDGRACNRSPRPPNNVPLRAQVSEGSARLPCPCGGSDWGACLSAALFLSKSGACHDIIEALCSPSASDCRWC
jgi:hypothetical protein